MMALPRPRQLLPRNLYEFLLMVKQTIRWFGVRGILKDLLFRFRGSPDGFPLPPSRLVFLVVGHGSQSDYYWAGKTVAHDIVEQVAACGTNPMELKHVLDFGCGCGRVLRQMKSLTKANLFGSDYNPALVDWCSRKLTFAQFTRNDLAPGLDYPNGHFDLVYGVSVFTHLSEESLLEWMEELERMACPGGSLVITTHGRRFLDALNDRQHEAFEAGKYVVVPIDEEGTNYYGSYFSRDYLEESMLRGFELLRHVPGRDHEDLKQDVYVLRRAS